MRKWMYFALLVAGFFAANFGYAQPEQPFTPGNVVLVDAMEDRLIEVEIDFDSIESGDFGEAQVVQEVTWPVGDDLDRRRPLGIAFDPNGTAYVGVTGVPTGATAVEAPEGLGQILRIQPDGAISFHTLPLEVNKGTWVSSFRPNEVFVMSNEPPAEPSPSQMHLVHFANDEISDITFFNLSESAEDDGSLANGKALQLPDGRVLIPSHLDSFINIYEPTGGDPIDQITTEKAYRSLAYLEDSNELLAIPGTSNVDRINMDGEILGTFDFTADDLGGVWNFTLVPGTENFIATNHNGPEVTNNQIFIYDSTRLNEAPFPAILDIVGLEPPANQLFDHAIVPEFTNVANWSIF